jgi:hypothetical protein
MMWVKDVQTAAMARLSVAMPLGLWSAHSRDDSSGSRDVSEPDGNGYNDCVSRNDSLITLSRIAEATLRNKQALLQA